MFKTKQYIRLLLIVCIPLCALPLWAQPATSPPSTSPIVKEPPEFNLKQANKQFDHLNLQLVENLNLEHLEHAISVLEKLLNESNNCINQKQKKLSSLAPLIEEATHAKEDAKGGADLVYLQQEHKKISSQMARCRLFSIRAQEAINIYQTTVTKIKKKQVLTRERSIWSLFEQLRENTTKPLLSSQLHYEIPNSINAAILLSFLALSIIAAVSIIFKIKTNILSCKVMAIKKIGISDGILWSLSMFTSCVTLYLSMTSTHSDSQFLILHIGSLTTYYLWALTLIVFIFKINMVTLFFYWYTLDSYFFRNLLIFLLSYYTLMVIGQYLLQAFTSNDLVPQLAQMLFLTGVLITAIGFFYYFCYTHRHIQFIRKYRTTLQRVIALLFVICGVLNLFGYYQLASHFTYACITSFAILFLIILSVYAIQKLYTLGMYSTKIHQYILRLFGYRPGQTIVEFIVLKITLQIIVIFVGIYFIGQSWGYGAYYVNKVYAELLNGVHFANSTFYPTRIMAGILVFCGLYLIFRSISTKLSKHTQFEDEEETQVAVASILTYLGFGCALMTALYISGIDFTGLAIVAGALSVGIGLGLQSIVNNFVSGIILLIEKPIKPGDRVSIDGVEGIVKKISVRSTQITTGSSEDVIIPNSSLITHPVTNFMFGDKRYLSIYCEVAVAYDSDAQLVKKLLLEAANSHDETLKTARSKPSVLFQSFGDSGMIFQIWFLIKDGNKKAQIHSDINFTIERLFREHQIKIAYPQRDINVRLSDIPALIPDK